MSTGGGNVKVRSAEVSICCPTGHHKRGPKYSIPPPSQARLVNAPVIPGDGEG